MGVIRVVRGNGTGPTATAAYDTALVDAGVHDYNLVTLSSVIPAGPPVETVGTAPDLGPAGGALSVVQAKTTVPPGGEDPAVAAVGWARSTEGPGIFYEADGTDRAAVRDAVERGLEHGCSLRPWEPADRSVVTESVAPAADGHACAVVCAVYGRSRPLL